MATTAPSTNPLAESLTQVTGLDPLSTTTGTTPISYDDLAFRAPEGDIISITGDPGTGATQAETWGHELSLEQMRQDQLEFEYAMQQDLLDQAYQQQQYELSAASGALASKSQAAQESQWGQQFALDKQAAERAAGLYGYQTEEARLANEAASYANMEAARKEQAARDMEAQQAGINEWSRWLGGAPISEATTKAWNDIQQPIGNPYQPSYAYKPGVSVYTPQFGDPNYSWLSKR